MISELEQEINQLLFDDYEICPFNTNCEDGNYGSQERCSMDYTSCNDFSNNLLDYIHTRIEDLVDRMVGEDEAQFLSTRSKLIYTLRYLVNECL